MNEAEHNRGADPARESLLHFPVREPERGRFSRRGFLAVSGAAAAAAALVGGAPAQPTVQDRCRPASGESLRIDNGVAPPPPNPKAEYLSFFTEPEARAVEALTARILPGTPEDPGAREAGVVFYIDHLLSNPGGFGQPTYRQPPFPEVYEGETPPPNPPGRQVIWVRKDQLPRYGYQSALTWREIYRMGIAELNRDAQNHHGTDFASLPEAQQDELVAELASDQPPSGGGHARFEQPSRNDFFELVRQHTIEGMFGDPIYGGNRGLAGWKLIGYPGAQRAYTPRELHHGPDPARNLQGLVQLAPVHPGQPGGNALLPVSGTCLPPDWEKHRGEHSHEHGGAERQRMRIQKEVGR